MTGREERYGLDWPGKRRAKRLATTPARGRLRSCPDESVDWARTRNVLVEGDNLDALKLLRRRFAGKVKVIYVDPPYNAGRELVYADGFREDVERSGVDARGRRHAAWLDVMLPRLEVARTLLRRDGVLFVSIDDGELAHLLLLCNEVFGEENHVATFVWEKKRKASNLAGQVRSITEYVVCYRRELPVALLAAEDVVERHKPYPFYNTPNGRAVLAFPGGVVRTRMPDGRYLAGTFRERRTEVRLLDDVTVRDGVLADGFRLEGRWRYSQRTLDALVASKARIELKGDRFKPYLINDDPARRKRVRTLLTRDTYGVGTNEDGNAEVAELFGGDVFSFPKPVSLIEKLIEIAGDEDAIVLDFFAGSGTTGHAVLARNAADGGRRRFVLVQRPEPLDPRNKAQRAAAACCDALGRPRTIAELTKERLRRAGVRLRASRPDAEGDVGFRVFKLEAASSR